MNSIRDVVVQLPEFTDFTQPIVVSLVGSWNGADLSAFHPPSIKLTDTISTDHTWALRISDRLELNVIEARSVAWIEPTIAVPDLELISPTVTSQETRVQLGWRALDEQSKLTFETKLTKHSPRSSCWVVATLAQEDAYVDYYVNMRAMPHSSDLVVRSNGDLGDENSWEHLQPSKQKSVNHPTLTRLVDDKSGGHLIAFPTLRSDEKAEESIWHARRPLHSVAAGELPLIWTESVGLASTIIVIRCEPGLALELEPSGLSASTASQLADQANAILGRVLQEQTNPSSDVLPRAGFLIENVSTAHLKFRTNELTRTQNEAIIQSATLQSKAIASGKVFESLILDVLMGNRTGLAVDLPEQSELQDASIDGLPTIPTRVGSQLIIDPLALGSGNRRLVTLQYQRESNRDGLTEAIWPKLSFPCLLKRWTAMDLDSSADERPKEGVIVLYYGCRECPASA